jgi:hypothetical protein
MNMFIVDLNFVNFISFIISLTFSNWDLPKININDIYHSENKYLYIMVVCMKCGLSIDMCGLSIDMNLLDTSIL